MARPGLGFVAAVAFVAGCGPAVHGDDGDGPVEVGVDDATAGQDWPVTSTSGPGADATGEPPPLDDATAGWQTTSATGTPEPDTTGGEEVVDEGPFACGLASRCATLSWHLEPWEAEDIACAGQLVASGAPGLLYARHDGYLSQSELVAIVVGDGTVVTQGRSRSCPADDEDCDITLVPWQTDPAAQQCDIANLDAHVAACEAGEPCTWMPYWDALADCQEVRSPSCEAIETILSGEAGGAGG